MTSIIVLKNSNFLMIFSRHPIVNVKIDKNTFYGHFSCTPHSVKEKVHNVKREVNFFRGKFMAISRCRSDLNISQHKEAILKPFSRVSPFLLFLAYIVIITIIKINFLSVLKVDLIKWIIYDLYPRQSSRN